MRKLQVLIALAVLLGMAACGKDEGKPAPDSTAEVAVAFDWKGAPDAAPASMSLYLFAKNGATMRYDFDGRAGTTIRVPAGRYDALCMNSDTELRYRNTARSATFEVTTGSATLLPGFAAPGVADGTPPRAEGTQQEPLMQAPAPLWSAHAEGIELTAGQTSLALAPRPAVGSYDVRIIGAENLEYAVGTGCSLSGLPAGWLAGKGKATGDCATIPFAAAISADRTSITGSLRSFGPAAGDRHQLTVYVLLEDGSKWYRVFDVTEQLRGAAEGQSVEIEVEGLPLPVPVGTGFAPSVDGWQQLEIPVDM